MRRPRCVKGVGFKSPSEAIFEWPALPGADLTRAFLAGTKLTRAKANGYTTWPDGFDPVAAGLIFE